MSEPPAPPAPARRSLPARVGGALADRVTRLGAAGLGVLSAIVDLWMVLVGVIAGLIRQRRKGAKREPGGVVAQMHSIGNRSLLFIAVTLGFIGMVMIYQACLQFQRSVGDLSQVGKQYLRLVISDFGPTLTGLMLATRVGAGIAAEIGSMKVTEQLDALRMSGVLPVDYLLVPRFTASMIMTLVLTVVGASIMIATGGLTAYVSFGVNPRTFFDLGAVLPRHVVLGLLKASSYGAAIPIVAGFCGLRARGSSEGVGWATTAAVVGSSFAIIALDFGLSVGALWLLGGNL
ncbi:MAG TPA: ABC transporter permease [Kofleriaceae bacterium]|nr:ABC transporter permease [Kofleriaceae bacterium]